MNNKQVAAVLSEIGTLLELDGANSFRFNTYHNAARAVEQLGSNIEDLVTEGKLETVKGIGKSLREKITTLVSTGSLPYHEDLKKKIPAGLLQMLKLPGIGPKKVKALYDKLDVDDLEKLRTACQSGEVAKLDGFGAKTQTKILEGLEFLDKVGGRVRIDQAEAVARSVLAALEKAPGVVRIALCGSLRRRRETIKDVDILISSDSPGPIMEAFVGLPEVFQVTGQGETKSSVILKHDIGSGEFLINADLRIVSDEQFPLALQHFTGSKEHNIAMRARAQEKGWKLNEYEFAGVKQKIREEADIYAAMGMEFIPPEMREDTGELDVALSKAVPKLVEVADIKGVFHNHTIYSDGANTVEEMARAAQELGFEYLGLGDHSQSLTVASGMSVAAVKKQRKEIDSLNKSLSGFRVFAGIECDILEDGSLDYDDDVLASFDYVVASVHTHFGLSQAKMTKRVLRALEHPSVTMLGHSTGRLLLRREGYAIDLDEVLKAAKEHGKMIEINAHPQRLDLDWVHSKSAKEMGIPLVINPDAHSTGGLQLYRFGVDVARRGWLEASDVFNTKSLAEVEKAFGLA